MTTNGEVDVYSEFFDFLIEKIGIEDILAFKVSEKTQQRAEYITERNKAGELTAEETIELEQMMDLTLLVSALKARALELSTVLHPQ